MRRCLCILGFLTVLLSSGARADVPREITFQAVVDSAGAPILTGNYDLTFRIYDDSSGGTLLWTEVQPDVPIHKGVFGVELGRVVPLALPFDVPYWLSMEVGVNGELSPRSPITSSAYSLMSATVLDSAIASEKIAAGTVVRSLNGATEALTLAPGANVSITLSGDTLLIGSMGGGGIDLPVDTTVFGADTLFRLFAHNGSPEAPPFILKANDRSAPTLLVQKAEGVQGPALEVELPDDWGAWAAQFEGRVHVSENPLDWYTWPQGVLEVDGLIVSGAIDLSQSGDAKGRIQWTGTEFQAHDGTGWKRISVGGEVGLPIADTLVSAAPLLDLRNNGDGGAARLVSGSTAPAVEGSNVSTGPAARFTSESGPVLEATNTGGGLAARLDGKVGVGVADPSEKLEVNGAIKIGPSPSPAFAANGVIQWTGSDVEAKVGGQWKSLTATGDLALPFSGSLGSPSPAFSLSNSSGPAAVFAGADSVTVRLQGGMSTSEPTLLSIGSFAPAGEFQTPALAGASPALRAWTRGTAPAAQFWSVGTGPAAQFDSGGVRIGAGSGPLVEQLEVGGGIRVGAASGNAAGTIQWTGSDLAVSDGTNWKALGGFGFPLADTVSNGATDPPAFQLTNIGSGPLTRFAGSPFLSSIPVLEVVSNGGGPALKVDGGLDVVGGTVDIDALLDVSGSMNVTGGAGFTNSDNPASYPLSVSSVGSGIPALVVSSDSVAAELGGRVAIGEPFTLLPGHEMLEVNGGVRIGNVPLSSITQPGTLRWTGSQLQVTTTPGDWEPVYPAANPWSVTPTNDIYSNVLGNVGIGTDTPSHKLHVEGGVRLSGPVGIGTASPASDLDVNGGVRAGLLTTGDLRAPTNDMSVRADHLLVRGRTDSSATIRLRGPSATSVDAIELDGEESSILLKDSSGNDRVWISKDYTGEIGLMDGSAYQVRMRGDEGDGGALLALNQTTGLYSHTAIELDAKASPTQGPLLTMRNLDNTKTVVLNADTSSGNGKIAVRRSGNTDGVVLHGDGKIAVRRSDNTDGVVLHADYQGSGTSRVVTDVLEITGGSDLAEPFPISDDRDIPPGTVLAIDPEEPGRLRMSDRAYDRRVAGIVSGAGGVNPGLTMGQADRFEDGLHVALSGRVYALADAAYGAIEPGDLLTTSVTPGYCMKATDPVRSPGSVIGKAMSSLMEGRGLVLVLVNLQ